MEHHRSASQFATVAHASVLIAIGFQLTQYRVVAELKLAADGAGAPSSPASKFIGHFNSDLCFYGSTYLGAFLVYYLVPPSYYKLRLTFDEVSVYLGFLCVLMLSSHIVPQGRFVATAAISGALVFARIIGVVTYYYRYGDGNNNGGDENGGLKKIFERNQSAPAYFEMTKKKRVNIV